MNYDGSATVEIHHLELVEWTAEPEEEFAVHCDYPGSFSTTEITSEE